MADAKVQAKRSDFGIRVVSAIGMLTVAGLCVWAGGLVWAIFVLAIAMGLLWEWRRLVAGFEPNPMKLGLWNVGGIIYIGFAAAMLLFLRSDLFGTGPLLCVLSMVIATDIGAYCAGRTIRGPKIAPSISPSKTWAGLAGGIVGASLAYGAFGQISGDFAGIGQPHAFDLTLATGALTAVVAQAGDFFESWMKRRAGVKDSGNMLPGHGGLFDRVDGLLAVLFVLGVLLAVGSAI
ncbi:MAG: phosphatidate cytidylyltransferase [Novosphingobium sp.]